MPGSPANLVQTHFRFYNDDTTNQATNTAYAAEDADISLTGSEVIDLRIQVEETAGGFPSGALDPNTLYYSKNGGGYLSVGLASSNVRLYNGQLTDGASTTQRLTGSATFTAGTVVEGSGLYSAIPLSSSLTECVYCLQLQSGDLSPGDTLDFQLQGLSSYTVTPRITIASGPSETTYCAGGDVQLEWDTDSWDGPESWVLTESGGDWTLTNGVSTWTATWDGTGSEVFEIASGTDENLTITVTAGACVCKEHYIGVGKKTGLLTTSVITNLTPRNDFRSSVEPDSTFNKCELWGRGSLVQYGDHLYFCSDASTSATWHKLFNFGDPVAIADGDKGDITVSGSGATWTIDNGAVTLAKQANIATARIMGRVTAGTGVQEALTSTQATTLINTFTTSLKGLAPASGGGTSNFLRADGSWAAPSGTTDHAALSNLAWASSGHTAASGNTLPCWTTSSVTPVELAWPVDAIMYRSFLGTIAPMAYNTITPTAPAPTDTLMFWDSNTISQCTVAALWAGGNIITQTTAELTSGNYVFSSTGTWVDPGVSITLSAGTWVIWGNVSAYIALTSGIYEVHARLATSGGTAVGQTTTRVTYANGYTNVGAAMLGPAVVSGSATYKIQAQFVLASAGAGSAGIYGNSDGTRIFALRIA